MADRNSALSVHLMECQGCGSEEKDVSVMVLEKSRTSHPCAGERRASGVREWAGQGMHPC